MAIEISTLNELQAINNDLSEDYVLVNDIDASDTSNWDGGKGWTPIGYIDSDYNYNDFSGTFNGDGYTISNLYYNRDSSEYITHGLFGCTWQSSGEKDKEIIWNVHLDNFDITCDFDGGGLIGLNEGGSIVYCSGKDIKVDGAPRIGGLIGRGLEEHGYLKSCWVEGNCQITGTDTAGGIIGINSEDAIIEDCYANCPDGYVSDDGTYGAGGVVGYASGWSYDIEVKNCYANIEVDNTNSEGGGVVGNTGGSNWTVTKCYYNSSTAGSTNDNGDKGKARTESNMTYPYASDTYENWDFSEVWKDDTDGTINNYYPYLREPVSGTDYTDSMSLTQNQVLTDGSILGINLAETLSQQHSLTGIHNVEFTTDSLINHDHVIDAISSVGIPLSLSLTQTHDNLTDFQADYGLSYTIEHKHDLTVDDIIGFANAISFLQEHSVSLTDQLSASESSSISQEGSINAQVFKSLTESITEFHHHTFDIDDTYSGTLSNIIQHGHILDTIISRGTIESMGVTGIHSLDVTKEYFGYVISCICPHNHDITVNDFLLFSYNLAVSQSGSLSFSSLIDYVIDLPVTHESRIEESVKADLEDNLQLFSEGKITEDAFIEIFEDALINHKISITESQKLDYILGLVINQLSYPILEFGDFIEAIIRHKSSFNVDNPFSMYEDISIDQISDVSTEVLRKFLEYMLIHQEHGISFNATLEYIISQVINQVSGVSVPTSGSVTTLQATLNQEASLTGQDVYGVYQDITINQLHDLTTNFVANYIAATELTHLSEILEDETKKSYVDAIINQKAQTLSDASLEAFENIQIETLHDVVSNFKLYIEALINQQANVIASAGMRFDEQTIINHLSNVFIDSTAIYNEEALVNQLHQVAAEVISRLYISQTLEKSKPTLQDLEDTEALRQELEDIIIQTLELEDK